MTRATPWLAAAVLTVALSACGTNNITDTADMTPTATTTATNVPPTPTFTSIPTSTLTATPTSQPATPTPTITQTSAPSATPSPTIVPSPQAARVLFSVDPMDAANPFPSNRLLDDTGHVHVPVSQLDAGLPATGFGRARLYIEHLAGQFTTLTGFSTFAAVRVLFDQPVVVDAGQNPRGFLLLEYGDLAAPPVTITASIYGPENTVEVQPVLPLKPKTTYALVVTTAVADVFGHHVQPSADFIALLAGTGLTPELTAWRTRLQPVIDFVAQAYSLDPSMLALVNLFTTAPTTDDLVAIQQRLSSGDLVPGAPVFENSPVPDLETGIFAAGTPQFQALNADPTRVSEVAVGSFDSYDFRNPVDGAFDPALLSGPTVPGVNHLDFYVTVPQAPRPAAGYPLIVFGHGLCESGRSVITSVPGEIGDAPLMGVAVSALQHGLRGTCTNFFQLNNVTETREYFRQTVADFMQLERMARNAHAAGIPPFDQVDTDHIMYFGVSLGGIMGSMFMAVEPDVKVGMLSVPGGGLANVLDSHDIGGLLEPLISFTVGIPQTNALFPRFLHRFQQMSQWVTDPADPINYAPYIIVPGAQLPGVPPKLILAHEGIVDNTIPNRTTDDLARTMRLPDLNLTRGCMDPDGCSGIWRFVMTDYGQPELSGHSASFAIPQARAQLAEFLRSFGTSVIDASPPTPSPTPTGIPDSQIDHVSQAGISVQGSLPPANPSSGMDTPPELDRGLAQAYQLPDVPDSEVTKVLILVPGFLAGAGTFDYLARRIALRTAGKTVVWAMDRRSNALEDQTGMDAAEAAKDPDVAKDYYFHDAVIGGKTFAGFAPNSTVSFESEWGIKTHVEDIDALVTAAIERYPNAAIFLGGHSLGGAIVPIYAAWDFGGRAGFERLSGLLLFEGAPNLSATAVSQEDYETNGVSNGIGSASLKALRTGSPISSLRPFVGPDLYLTAEIIAMRVSSLFGAPDDPTPDADLFRSFFNLLFGLNRIPTMTNRAALGLGFDDDFQPLAFVRVSIGSAVGPVGPNPRASLFANFIVPGDVLLAPSDVQASYGWEAGSVPDPTDIQTFARIVFAGPSNFIEWYFPARLTLDVGVTAGLNVQRAGDWRKDVYGMAVTENARVDVPVFTVGGTRGLVRDVAAGFDPYRDSIAPTLRNGMARSASASGFVEISKAGYVHIDVLTAADGGPGNGIFGPMVEWMDAAAQLAPPPH